MLTEKQVNDLIVANPKACWRTLHPMLLAAFSGDAPVWALQALEDARPDCGYDCDGDDGNGGCPVSGRREP